MYRILAQQGENRERRNQLLHPPYDKPELLATRPNELWSWDITKLLGPAKWTYYYLYVILDVFSRYVVGWTIQHRELASIAKHLIAQAIQQQGIEPDQLTVHADRGSSMRSKPVAFLLADLGRHQDPLAALHLDRQPLLGGAVQDAQVPTGLPGAVPVDPAGPRVRPTVLPLVQPPAPALRHRPSDTSDRASRPRSADPRVPCRSAPSSLECSPRALRQQTALPTSDPHRRLDQQAGHPRGCSLINEDHRLIRVDRYRVRSGRRAVERF